MNTLDVNDPEAYRLAEAIAKETGETIALVVTRALRERLERLPKRQDKATLEELRAIASRSAELLRGRYVDHAEFLYNENGLPK